MPRNVWHNVLVDTAATISVAPAPFSFDWKDVEHGLPLSSLEEFAAYSGIPVKELLQVVIPLRTLKHRRQRHERLSVEESDRLARVARIYRLAAKVYGNPEDGRDWLLRPKRAFEGKTALAMLRTEVGEHAVQDSLVQIDEGYFA